MGDYPVDGFELNLKGRPYFFHPNEVESGRHIMTEWIRRVHEVVNYTVQTVKESWSL